MALSAFHNGLDDVETTSRFFVELTKRLGDGEPCAGEDALKLSRTLGVPLPYELVGTSIVLLDENHTQVERKNLGLIRPEIVITYPPAPNPGTIARTFKKCFNVCKTVGGAKVCAEVCVSISIGLSGVHGDISATVSVHF